VSVGVNFGSDYAVRGNNGESGDSSRKPSLLSLTSYGVLPPDLMLDIDLR